MTQLQRTHNRSQHTIDLSELTLKYDRGHTAVNILGNYDICCSVEQFEECNMQQELEKIEGVRDVDYSGHFGDVIFIEVDEPFDDWSEVESTIIRVLHVAMEYDILISSVE